jgi:eukaryotic-like serine/threonine-protein kinase
VGDPEDTDVDEPTDATKREGVGTERPKPTSKPRPQTIETHLDRGTTVGRYIIIGVIGSGGMGVVYHAYDPELDRKVAIKLLQAKRTAGDQAWLVREAQAMARLSHPNVIAVHDVGTLPGERVFVAMELVDGTTLRRWLRLRVMESASEAGEGQHSWREVLAVMRAAGAGLAAAHAAGLVHRDFKPDNVLVGKDGRVRVVDFGLARLRSDDDTPPPVRPEEVDLDSQSPLSASLTVAGTVVGTPAYMAPELLGGHSADARSDQFSFGVALYEALYRKRPYDRDAPKGTKAKPPPDGDVPLRVQRVVMRAISLDPNQRYPTMDAMLADLVVDTAPRRRIAIGAAIVGALGVAVATGVVLSSSPRELCTGSERRLAGVWDPATRSAIKQAFDATKRPFAGQAFANLERQLDGYAREWTTAAVESCEATRIRGEQTEEVLSLRQTCLDERLEDMRALTKLLASADAEVVDKGDKVAGGLAPLQRCANIAALRAPGNPPTDAGGKLDKARTLIADAKALMLAGHYSEALDAGNKAIALADEAKWPPYKADALVVEAAALAGQNNIDGSAKRATEAAWVALGGKRDDIVAEASLAAAVAAAQKNVGEARIWLGLARASTARFGHDDGLELRALEVEGLVEAVSGNMAEAIVAQQKALAAAERLLGPNNPGLWADEEVIAVSLAKAGAWDKARPHYERAMALHEATVGPDHPDIALMLTNLGACFSHAGEAAKAKAAYERALAIREKANGKRNPMLILTLNNLADGLYKSGDITGALFYLDRAQGLSDELLGRQNAMTHAVMTTRAEALTAAGRFSDARAAYDEVIALETKQASPLIGPIMSSRASMEITAKQWPAAASYAQKAIAALEASGGKEAPELWQPLTSLARADIQLKRPGEAKPLLERALAIGDKAQVSAADLAPTRALLSQLSSR